MRGRNPRDGRPSLQPLHDRKEPTFVQKKPGRWVARFHWEGGVVERSLHTRGRVSPRPRENAGGLLGFPS